MSRRSVSIVGNPFVPQPQARLTRVGMDRADGGSSWGRCPY
ncbi:hypothetical protein [Sphingomonas nostoxanthinifaciens]|nr:hypothetical protein [Sphingomonas nostoxanthinifaciens]